MISFGPIANLPISTIDKTAKGVAPTNVMISQTRQAWRFIWTRVWSRVN